MHCPNCGSEINADDKFCGECGATIPVASGKEDDAQMACDSCGDTLDNDDAFCGSCGQKVVASSRNVVIHTPASGNRYPVGPILLILIMSCGASFIFPISPSLWLITLLPVSIGIGICARVLIRKMQVKLSSRVSHSFSVFFFAAFSGFLLPPSLFAVAPLFSYRMPFAALYNFLPLLTSGIFDGSLYDFQLWVIAPVVGASFVVSMFASLFFPITKTPQASKK